MSNFRSLIIILLLLMISFKLFSKINSFKSELPKTIFKTNIINVQKDSNSISEKIYNAIKKYSEKCRIDFLFILAIAKVESNFLNVTSKKGAVGIMQLMKKTALKYRCKNRYNINQNIETGILHVKYLLKKYENRNLALAAYNAGEGRIEKYKGIPPFRETSNYVKRVNYYYNLYNKLKRGDN